MSEQNINSFTDLISELKESIINFRNQLATVHNIYLNQLNNLDASDRKEHQQSKAKVKQLYNKIQSILSNYVKNFSIDYSDTLEMATKIKSLRQKYKSNIKRYPPAILKTLETAKVYQLLKKQDAILSRHNKLAILYNERFRRFQAIKGNLGNETLVYQNSTKESMNHSFSDLLSEFQGLIITTFAKTNYVGAQYVTNLLNSFQWLRQNNNSANSEDLKLENLFTRWPSAEKINYNEILKELKEEEKIYKKNKLATNAKLLIGSMENKKDIKDSAIKIWMDVQNLSGSSNFQELKEMLHKFRYLVPNFPADVAGVDNLVGKMLQLEGEVMNFVETDVDVSKLEEEIKLQEIFKFLPENRIENKEDNEQRKNKILLYYKYKSLISLLLRHLLAYKRNKWIEDKRNKKLTPEILRDYYNYFRRVSGYTEAIEIEKYMKKCYEKIVSFGEMEIDGFDEEADEEKTKLWECFMEVSRLDCELFKQTLKAAQYDMQAKKKVIEGKIEEIGAKYDLKYIELEKLTENYNRRTL